MPAASTLKPLRSLTGRQVLLLSGRVVLAVDDWPILGSPQAPHIIAALFDFTCPVCREMHRIIEDARQQSDGSWAVLMLPVPVDPTCNPKVKQWQEQNAHACKFARLGLLVWQAAHQQYEAFDQWMFASEEHPLLGVACEHARRMLNGVQINPNIPEATADARIAQGVALFAEIGGNRKIPMLLLPHGILAGRVSSPRRLLEILETELGIQQS